MERQSDVQMLTLKEAALELGVSLTKLREFRELDDDRRLKTISWGNEQRVPRWYLKEWQRAQLQLTETITSNLLR
jgi:hypothetical protein